MTVVKKRGSEKPVVVDENWYNAQLKNVEEKAGKFGPCFRVTFSLLDVQGAEAAIVISQDLYPKSKLDLLLKSLGYNVPDGADFDTDILMKDKPKAIILTEHNNSADGQTTYNNIAKIKPWKQVAASVAAPAPVVPPAAPAPVVPAAAPAPVVPVAVPVVPAAAPAPVVPVAVPVAAAPAAPAPVAPAAPVSYIENVDEIDFNA